MEEKKEPRVFVTTDTHGCYKQLLNCLIQARFDYDIDTLIHLGDTVDRGPDSYEVIELLLSIKNLISLRGNHDDWFNEWITKGRHPGGWQHGAAATISSYANKAAREILMHPWMGGIKTDMTYLDLPPTHIEFFKNQQVYYIDAQNRLFCHAGYDPTIPVDQLEEFMFYWDRTLVTKLVHMRDLIDVVPKYNDVNDFKRVFIGHTPTISFPQHSKEDTPMYLGQLVELDTGGCFGGKISLIDITDDENHILYQH